MPETVVDINLRSETGAVPQQTYSDLVVIGDNPDIADPTYNEPIPYDTADAVETDFGSNSDVYEASREIQQRGADQWWVVMLDSDSHTEVVADSDSSSTQTGTLENTPVKGGVANVTITLDGTEQTVVPTTETSPEAPDTGEAKLNFDTGEVMTGEASSGADSGIEVQYETNTWGQATTEMTPQGLDLCVLADVRADKSYIGDADELVGWASSNDAAVILAYQNGAEYADDVEAMNAYHDIGEYIQSGNLMTIAHKSSDDVAAGVAGRISTKYPWFDPFWDGGADYNFTTGRFRKSLIGSPSQPGTMEGGNDDEAGPTNVLHSVNGTQVLSNSLTTAGASSNYQYFDVRRTETFLISEIQQALNALRLRRDQIPFADIGRTLIQDAITNRLNKYVSSGGITNAQLQRQRQQEGGGDQNDSANNTNQTRNPDQPSLPTGPTGTEDGGVPLRTLEVRVPRIEDLSEDDRANRQWTGITVTGELAGNVHTFGIELTVQV